MSEPKMKPIIILPPGTMSKEDQEQLRQNGLCVVEAKEPALVRFVDPLPAISSRTQIEDAAIRLSRKLMTRGGIKECTGDSDLINRASICRAFVDIMAKGTPLDPNETEREERERYIFDQAKADELRRLAREEAKAERAAAKAAKKETAKK